jgi:hypothetical protein
MSKATELAAGRITGADSISVELVEPSDAPAVVMLHWPPEASITDPTRLPVTANAIMQVLAAAIARLAAIRPPGL